MLDTGVHSTLEDLARVKGLAPSYVSGILRLTLLAPEIVEAILDGRQPVAMQLDDLLEGFPLEWEGQRLGRLRKPTGRPPITTIFMALGGLAGADCAAVS
jgi:hypothetical protein